jgi:hypothetical protein
VQRAGPEDISAETGVNNRKPTLALVAAARHAACANDGFFAAGCGLTS